MAISNRIFYDRGWVSHDLCTEALDRRGVCELHGQTVASTLVDVAKALGHVDHEYFVQQAVQYDFH